MSVVATIARHVVRDAVRSRVLHAAALLALALAVAAPLAGRLSAGQDLKVVKDLGLAAIELAGLFVAVFMGIGLAARQRERRALDAVLSKPIRRCEFIFGQYAGLLATLALGVTVLAIAMYVVLAVAAWWGADTGPIPAPRAPAVDPALLKAVFLIFLQLAVVAAAALCFSTFLGPAPASASTFGFYVSGHFSAELRTLDDVVDSPLAASAAAWLSHVLPDLAAFDVKAAVVHAQPVTAAYMALTACSGAAWVLAFLVLAAAVFTRRDLA